MLERQLSQFPITEITHKLHEQSSAKILLAKHGYFPFHFIKKNSPITEYEVTFECHFASVVKWRILSYNVNQLTGAYTRNIPATILRTAERVTRFIVILATFESHLCLACWPKEGR